MQFPPSQPDEGYSEDPLNPSTLTSTSAAGSTLAMPAVPSDIPAWMARNLPYLPISAKTQIAISLLDDLPTSVVAQITERLHPRLYIDFIQYLPPEVCLKILSYLDPVSLLNVARSCRGWHSLALDRKLWERLYHLEGWQAIYPEIQAWEEKKNKTTNGINSSVSSQHRIMASEGGHTSKKRAISEDDDLEMTDAERLLKPEDSTAGGSLFGSPGLGAGSSQNGSSNDMDVDTSASTPHSRTAVDMDTKAKGKVKTETKEDPSAVAAPQRRADDLKSELWTWDVPSSRYKLNWKYVYNLRRRLEANWEQGKYVNFQLPRPDHPEEGHQECIYTLQFDSRYLVSGSRDRTIRIWSMGTRRLLRAPLKGHEGSVLCLQFDADPEEDLIVSGSSDSNVILWRFSTGEVLQRLTKAHSESVLNVKFDKRILVTCSKDKSIKIFNRRPLKYGQPGYDDPELLNTVPIRIRDYRYGNPADDLPLLPALSMIGRLEGHGAAVNAVQIYGNEVVSASGDRNIKVWDWTKQVCSRTVVGHSKGIACVQYDGRRIVSGSSDNEVKVFDRFSGLEVASLRAHRNLVRTVQAGFGDLPYSEEEDKAEAKRLDLEYLQALETGVITVDSASRRSRPRNAGSRRLEDITAYGASLPPGGGGGKYARIISGSYDHRIIIWRRDKDGVWQPVHRMRQEEAAEAAQHWAIRTGTVPATTPAVPPPPTTAAAPAPAPAPAAQATPTATTTPASTTTQSPPPPQQGTHLPLQQSSRQTQPGPAPAAVTPSQPPTASCPPTTPSRTTIENPIIATITPESASSFMALIDIIVPQGATALQQALASYPTMLAYHSHLHAAIGREPSPVVRSQMRQIVANALMATQNAQSQARLASTQDTPSPIEPPNLPSLPTLAGPSSSAAVNGSVPNSSTARTSATTTTPAPNRAFDPIRNLETDAEPEQYPPSSSGAGAGGGGSGQSQSPHHLEQSGAGSQSSAPRFAGHLHIQGTQASGSSSTQHPQQQQVPSAPIQRHSTPVPTPQPTPQPPQQAQQQQAQQQVQAQGQAQQEGQAQGQEQPQGQAQGQAQQAAAQQDGQAPHHPHINNTENIPARVFKLQFDARRIICCSQTSVIVGWDFCNGDPELEYVSRIFRTIE